MPIGLTDSDYAGLNAAWEGRTNVPGGYSYIVNTVIPE
jgi:hypothetical protein